MLNLRKKLLVSIFTLMLALVAVSTTTYAWFTMGTKVNVSGIHMEVKGEDGLSIRVVSINGVDAKEIDAKIEKEDMKVSTFKSDLDLSQALTGITLSPLTYKKAYVGEDDKSVPAELVDYEDKAPVSSSYYIHIEFEFFSNNNLEVYFENIQASAEDGFTFTSPIEIPTFNGQSQVYEGGVVTSARLANALRVAYSGYQPEVTPSEGETPAKLTYPAMTKFSQNVVAPELYDKDPLNKQYGSWLGASVYYYNAFVTANSELDVPEEEEDVYFGYTINGTEKTEFAKAASKIVQLVGSGKEIDGYYGRATVTVWLEGWDSDCFNAIVEDEADLIFEFTGIAPTPTE